MDAQGWVLIITAATGAFVAIVSAIFAGFIALKQLPQAKEERREAWKKQETAIAAVHTLTNNNYEAQRKEIELLQGQVIALSRAAVTKADELAAAQAVLINDSTLAAARLAAQAAAAAVIAHQTRSEQLGASPTTEVKVVNDDPIPVVPVVGKSTG